MPSLLDAIESKYGENAESVSNNDHVEFVIYVPKTDHRKRLQRILVLDKCEVDCSGDIEVLKDTLSDLQELDLGHNQLTQWTEIWKILQCAPSLNILNLTCNPLGSMDLKSASQLSEQPLPQLSRLSVLILIGTKIDWDSIHFILSSTPNLKDLHLSKNNLDKVISSRTDSEHISYPSVTKLMFDENTISDWDEIQKLGQLFPNIEQLGISDCPVSVIPENVNQYFQKVKSIYASNIPLQDLTSISNFSLFSALTEIRIQGIVLFPGLNTHERRQLFIALLPTIKRLNGGAEISTDEREASERAFIRYFMEQEEPRPKRYHELISIHGELLPLADVKLKPQTHVKIKFIMDEILVEKSVKVYQSVRELKVFLEPIFGILPNRMRLHHNDRVDEMRFPDKKLYTYNMKDGDNIFVYLKSK